MAVRSYCVILADVVRSRRGADAVALQAALEDAVATLSQPYEPWLAARLTLSAGDELQALLKGPAPAFDLAFDLADRLHPLDLRFGVGLGELATPLRSTTASLSGRVFYEARDAVQTARRGGQHIVFAGFGELSSTLNVLGDCALAIMGGWTSAQRESVRALLRHGSHQAAAEALGRSRSTVTRNLQRALAVQVVRCREQLRSLLAQAVEAETGEEG
jgi:hypothetical protein